MTKNGKLESSEKRINPGGLRWKTREGKALYINIINRILENKMTVTKHVLASSNILFAWHSICYDII